MNVEIRSVNPDGTVSLVDGREMQMVMAPSGVIGLKHITNEDRVGQLDQTGPVEPPKITGLDQISG